MEQSEGACRACILGGPLMVRGYKALPLSVKDAAKIELIRSLSETGASALTPHTLAEVHDFYDRAIRYLER